MRQLGWLPQQPVETAQEELQEDQQLPEEEPAQPEVVGEGLRQPPPVEQLPAEVERAGKPDLPSFKATEAETVYLTDPEIMTVELAADGSGVREVRLHKYLTDDREEQVVIGRPQFPFGTAVIDFEDWQIEEVEQREHTETRLVVAKRMSNGLELVEVWELLPTKEYQMSYQLSLRNTGEQPIDVRELAVSAGAIHTTTSERARMRSGSGGEGAIDLLTQDAARPEAFLAKKLTKADAGDQAELEAIDVDWIALHSKYFLFYLNGIATPFSGCRIGIENIEEENGESPWLYGYCFLPPVRVQPEGVQTYSFTVYMGPKEYDKLEKIGGGLQSIMRLDLFLFWHPSWMSGISKLILRSLITLRDFFDHSWGYGFAIIIITFVVKMIFWPLTHRSTTSMRKMQKIQPMVKEIREKYKEQPEKMNRKMMELYRAHKVNPLGGCLPILLQIPVFFALFNTLRSAIELRHAEFLWVSDLSLPDTIFSIPIPGLEFAIPIRPLAIFMGLSMFGQQKMMPASPDPQQAKMMSFMSLFFVVIFYGMPSGLTLYWTVNQLLTIGQTLISRKLHKDEMPELANEKQSLKDQGVKKIKKKKNK